MKIIGFDSLYMDMNILCHHMPKENELVELLDVSLMGGGKVPNAILTAARLGARTAFWGAVGEDRYGTLCRKDMEDHGIDVSGLIPRKGKTSLCLSIVDQICHGKHYIESKSSVQPVSVEALPLSMIEKGDYLMLYQMDETASALAAYAHKVGGKVVADGDEYDQRTQDNLKSIDVFIMSEYYYRHLFKEGSYEHNLRKIAEMGPEIVVVTLGAKGAAGLEKGCYFEARAYSIEVCDTTGAGDVFHGAFTYGLSEGMTAKEAARFAGAVSAIKCTMLGGRTGIPTRSCVDHFMETGEILPCDFAAREEKYRMDMWKN